MTISDLSCAQFCSACYSDPGQFDAVHSGPSDDDVWVGLKRIGSDTVVAFRGSITVEDWLRDLQANMIDDPVLGQVEYGFHTGLTDVMMLLVGTSGNIFVTGHSLGAARALIFAAMMTSTGWIPSRIVTFGSPRPGGAKLKKILSTVTDLNSYRNRNDPVTDVPPTLAGMPYCHPRDLIEINGMSEPYDIFDVMRDHHIQNYLVGMENIHG